MYVYVAPLKDFEVFKIGKSAEPQKRIKDLSRFYRFHYEKILLIKCDSEKDAFILEKCLHKLYRKFNKRINDIDGTEFFSNDIYEKTLKTIKDICDINQNDFQYLPSESIDELKNEANYSEVGRMLKSIGEQLKRVRLRMGFTQEELAKSADVSLNSIKKLESGKGASLSCLIRVCVVLGKTQWFNCLSPIISISPLDILKLGKERKRARKRKEEKNG